MDYGKLIELLNEYTKKEKFGIIWKLGEDPIGVYGYVYDKYGLGWASKLVIISKEYGFISWLVENDKIDRKKIPAIIKVDGYLADGSDTEYYNMEESLLMLLSISSSPIDDLISYLK